LPSGKVENFKGRVGRVHYETQSYCIHCSIPMPKCKNCIECGRKVRNRPHYVSIANRKKKEYKRY